jgi:hypothetical protein
MHAARDCQAKCYLAGVADVCAPQGRRDPECIGVCSELPAMIDTLYRLRGST